MIDVKFFQATATALPTVLIATVLTSRYLEQKQDSSETVEARTIVASVIMAVSIVGEAAALVGLADSNGSPTRGGTSTAILFFVVLVALFIDMAALALITALTNLRLIRPSARLLSFSLITVALVVVALLFAAVKRD